MSYDLKTFYASVDELTTRDRGLAIVYGRVPDNLGGGVVPIKVDATGALLLGTSVTLNVSDITPVTVVQSNPSLLNANVNITPSTTATLTNVVGSAVSIVLLAANASRKMAAVFNESATSTAILYLKFSSGASTTSYTVQVPAGSYYEFPTPIFTGIVSGIWATSPTATARLTEFA